MKDNTQRVPFNLELANKITKGETEGKFVTRDGRNARILCTDLNNEPCSVIAAVEYYTDKSCTKTFEVVHYFHPNGKFSDITDNQNDLFIELPNRNTITQMTLDNLKMGERAWIKYDDEYIFVKMSFVGDKLVNVLDVSGNNGYLTFTKTAKCWLQKPEFKPFDKVLVRNSDKSAWLPRLFDSHVEQANFWTQDGKQWEMCISYEGNEELVNTTKKPQY